MINDTIKINLSICFEGTVLLRNGVVMPR